MFTTFTFFGVSCATMLRFVFSCSKSQNIQAIPEMPFGHFRPPSVANYLKKRKYICQYFYKQKNLTTIRPDCLVAILLLFDFVYHKTKLKVKFTKKILYNLLLVNFRQRFKYVTPVQSRDFTSTRNLNKNVDRQLDITN